MYYTLGDISGQDRMNCIDLLHNPFCHYIVSICFTKSLAMPC